MSSLEDRERSQDLASHLLDKDNIFQFSGSSIVADDEIVSVTAKQPDKHQYIVRSPYLQQGTESSIIIRWATNAPVQGKV